MEKTKKKHPAPFFDEKGKTPMVEMTDMVSGVFEKDETGEYKPILSGVSFKMFAGECWGIGADEKKYSATLSAILANMRPYLSGKIRVGSVGMYRKKNFMLPHIFFFDTADMLYPNMTVLEELMFCAGPKKGQTAAERQKELLDLLCELDLGYISLAEVKRLRRAERVLVLLLVAALSDSKIIIADVYDVELNTEDINRMKRIVERIKAEKRLLIIAADVPRLIGMVCDHLVYLCEGKMLYSGPVNELLKSSDDVVCAMTAPDVEAFAKRVEAAFPKYGVEVADGTIYLHNHTGREFVSTEFFRALAKHDLSPATIRISVGRIENSFNALKASSKDWKEALS